MVNMLFPYMICIDLLIVSEGVRSLWYSEIDVNGIILILILILITC